MAPISVDPDTLADAASRYGSANTISSGAMAELAAELDRNWGCAGTDNAGMSWADSYDSAAFDAVSTGTDITNAFGKLHDLLAATGINHANAENANTVPPPPPLPTPPQLPHTDTPRFNGSYGGDTDAPMGWGLITRWLQGHMWPNGDPDKLRGLGSAWRTAAEELRRASDETNSAWTGIEELASDELPQVLAQMDGVYIAAQNVADQFDILASACGEWATTIQEAHQSVVDIVGTAIVAGTIAGAVAGFFTLGVGTVAVTGATGSVIAGSVIAVLTGVEAASAIAVGVTVATGAAAIGIAIDVQPLLEASPTTFDANTGGTNWHYKPPQTRDLPGIPNARLVKRMNGRRRWTDDKGSIYEWDYQHGTVEKYSKNGKHLGEYDPNTGVQTKPADPTRNPGR
jgi:hypothetical protein